jgi:hypothetical protein
LELFFNPKKKEFLFLATRCPRCKIEQHYLNVLVAHVLLNQCHVPTPSINIKYNEQLFVRASSTKKRLIDLSSTKQSSSSSPRLNSIINKPKDEEIKEKDLHPQQQIPFSSNDVSSYKMSVLDGTHALEFTSLDNDGRQRKGHLCLFCGKVKFYSYENVKSSFFFVRFIIVNMV